MGTMHLESSDDEDIIVRKKSVMRKVIDSDDDDEDENSNGAAEQILQNKKTDEDILVNKKENSHYENNVDKNDSFYDEDEEKLLINDDNDDICKDQSPMLDVDEYSRDQFADDEQDTEIRENLNSKTKKRSYTERKSKTNAVQQIHSETQRLVRESRVSLPYHRPKQRTLVEFLERRQTLKPTTTSLKMSTECLGQVWKHLEQREKEAEEFYKSDSDESSCNIKDDEKIETCNLNDDANDLETHTKSSNAEADNFNKILCNSKSENSIFNNQLSCNTTAHDDCNNACNNELQIDNCDNRNQCSENDIRTKETQLCSNNDNKLESNTKVMEGDGNIFLNDVNIDTVNNSVVICSSELDRSESVGKDMVCSSSLNSERKLLNNIDNSIEHEKITSDENFTYKTDIIGGNEDDKITSDGISSKTDNEFHQEHNDDEKSANKCHTLTNERNNEKNNSNSDFQLPQPLVEDSCDIHLHYSESQNEDTRIVPILDVLPSLPPDDENNAMDIQLEEKEAWLKNCSPPSPSIAEDNTSILKRLARRSLPGVGDITKMKPRLSGAPDEVIDLDAEDSPGYKGVVKLVERFMKHSSMRRNVEKKHDVQIGIVCAEKCDDETKVLKDIVTVTLGEDETSDDPTKTSKPGAKLQRLKEELQQQMAQRRVDEWSKRVQQERLDNEEEEELSDCGGLMNEMEIETNTESEESEDEEEEEESLLIEKKRKKNAFFDDEADVSDDIETSEGDEDEEEEQHNKLLKSEKPYRFKNGNLPQNKEIQNDDSDTVPDNISQHNDNLEKSADTKRVFSNIRILDASSDDDTREALVEDNGKELEAIQDKTCDSIGGIESVLEKKNMVKLDSFYDSTQEKSMNINMVPSPSNTPTAVSTPNNEDEETESDMVKKESRKVELKRITTFDMFVTQDVGGDTNMENVNGHRKEYISEDYSPPSQYETGNAGFSKFSKNLYTEPEPLNTQENMDELAGLCSGQFSGEIKHLVDPQLEVNDKDLEDELLGLCSGKFNTQPLNKDNLEQGTHLKKSLSVIDSDYEDDNEEIIDKSAHKKYKKLNFSDDEDDDPQDCDRDSENENNLLSDEDEKLLDYDSEENEVMLTPKKHATTEFFDQEAELSESEWDSADEDEQGLDDLEWEEGDDEKLDQKKVKEQLDKIHMRRLLDEDRREVRLLQELLLEDGEMHSEGGGRERKFRWKNINNVDDADMQHPNSDNEAGEDIDIEDEEQWRRMRHERETFLQQQKMKTGPEMDDVLNEGSDSQLLKLGQAALKRMNSLDQTEKLPTIKKTMSDPLVSPDPKHPFKLQTKRGSFLSRGESMLSRIAELARGSSESSVTGPKNSRGFVFAALSPEKKEEKNSEIVQVTKRKSNAGVTPPKVKKLKLSDDHSRGRRLLDLLS